MSAATATQPVIGHRRRVSAGTGVWIGRIAVPATLALVWAVADISSDLTPSIGSTVTQLVDGFRDGWISAPLASTAQAVIGGFAIAAAIGLPVGVALGRSRFLSSLLDPVISGLFAVPRIIVYPVLLAMFGVGVGAKLWMAVISAFFPIAMNAAAGMRAVNPTLVKLGHSMNASRLQMVRKIYLPAASPSVMVGLRIGFSISFIAVIVAELFATSEGLGRLIDRAYAFQKLPQMFAVVLLIIVIAFVVNLTMWVVERRLQASVG